MKLDYTLDNLESHDEKLSLQLWVAVSVLRKLKSTFGECVFLAGGAPRNWYEEKLANDLDFYIDSSFGTYTKSKLLEAFSEVSSEGTLETLLDKAEDTSNNYEGSALNIRHIWSYKIKGVVVQFIFVTPPQRMDEAQFQDYILNSFDVDICRIGIDHNSDFIKKECFLKDLIEDKTLTVRIKDLSPYQLKRCLSVHVPKLQKYYPEHELKFVAN